MNKGDYWQIADLMQPEEMHSDIKQIIDDLQDAMERVKITEEK